jgi:hypothetical protein
MTVGQIGKPDNVGMEVCLGMIIRAHCSLLPPFSNGSGKSSLAMAALWALTGSMDPRRAQDGKVSDVVHDEAKV